MAIGLMILVVAIWSSFAGFLAGVLVFLWFYSYRVKLNIRRRLEFEKYDLTRPVDILSDTRLAKRDPTNYLPVSVRAPVLDAAGVATAGDEQRFGALLKDISRLGATIISPYFIPKGVVILISCDERKLHFPLQEAQVRDVTLIHSGIRIGLQFVKPLKEEV